MIVISPAHFTEAVQVGLEEIRLKYGNCTERGATMHRIICKKNDLLYYLSRSFFRDGDQIINLVAEEAEQGNVLAIKALEARRLALNPSGTRTKMCKLKKIIIDWLCQLIEKHCYTGCW